ncbi:MAG: alpha-(1-_3)-arabinofuranosyltransferase family protein, partial [Actinomycetota bacterium]
PDVNDRWWLLRRWYAVAAFVPAFLAEPGGISADTKTYLTVDPGRLMSQASSMWDPSVGAGTVPHQNIGYLFPLGPYHWLLDTVGVPSWIAQRLLWGLLVFAAAWGACRLGRLLGWSTTMAGITGLAYGFTPYVLSYLARLSVILFPWAAMPWLIVLAARLVRRPSWRTAATFAGLVALVGSVNATALVLAGLGPLVWVVADLATGRVRLGTAIRGLVPAALLSLGVSAWWIAGLWAQGSYGLPILRFTETYRAISGASTPAEVVRGLGYWFFYGGDRLDHWIGPSSSYTNDGWLILLGFGVAMGSLLGLLIPFARRGTIVALFVVGMVMSVGGAPIGSSSVYGSWFADMAADSTIGGALRSTTRAMPLVVLGLGAGFGALVDLARRRLVDRRAASADRGVDPRLPVVVGSAMLAGQMFPWFIGTMTTDSLLRDDPVPAHIDALATHLDDTGEGRVLVMPGSDFAYPRTGGTIDPILPGVIDRPVLYRELVPQGSPATADLLNAFERRLHDGWSEPEAWPTIARLLDATAVVARNDHQYERFRLARPGQLWPQLSAVFGDPDHQGPSVDDLTEIDLVDGITYADPTTVDRFPMVAAWDLATPPDASDPVTIRPVDQAIVLDGSGDGIVDLAGAGLLRPETVAERAIRPRASLDDPDTPPGSDHWWVVTDTNRRQGRRWSTIGSNLGPIEPVATRTDLDPDQSDQRLDVFDDEVDPDRQTVAEHRGDIAAVRSSYTGSRIAYTPEDAPFMATDGDLFTAWRTAVFDDARGLEFHLDLRSPTDADHVVLIQPVTGVVDRFITRVRLTLSDDAGALRSVEVSLDERSRGLDGQRIDLPPGPAFVELTIEILDDNLGPLASYAGRPGVGFAEVRLPGVADDRVV